MSLRFQKSDITTSQLLTGGTPLAYTTTIGRAFKLESVHFHASENITETLTITLVSAKGANYNVVLRKKDLVGEQDFVFIPEGQVNFQVDDEIKVECTAANTTGTIYANIKTSELPFN